MVYVISKDGQPLIPTNRSGKVYRLLKNKKKARVAKRCLFTIQLLYEPGTILHRNNYTCQVCGKKNTRLEVHHIVFRSQGGTDDESNLITLCENCHIMLHKGKIVINKKPKKMNLKYATHMSIIKR